MTTDDAISGPRARWLLAGLAAVVIALTVVLLVQLREDPATVSPPAPPVATPPTGHPGPPPVLVTVDASDPRAVAGLSVFEASSELLGRFRTAMAPAFKSCGDELRARRPDLRGTAQLQVTAVNYDGVVGFVSGTINGIPDRDFQYCVTGLIDMVSVPVEIPGKGMQRIALSFEIR